MKRVLPLIKALGQFFAVDRFGCIDALGQPAQDLPDRCQIMRRHGSNHFHQIEGLYVSKPTENDFAKAATGNQPGAA